MTQNTKNLVPSQARGSKRRARILSAFHDCIIAQGYAKTTLRDVAQTAGMSASHLLYYFPGKDVLLEQFFQDIANQIVSRIEGLSSQSPEKQIELLSDLFFTARGITRSEIGFMLECFGVAVHDEDLRQEKTDLDKFCKSYLQELFKESPCDSSNVGNYAEISYALLIGLRTAAYFDRGLKLSHARDLFYREMMTLAGYHQST